MVVIIVAQTGPGTAVSTASRGAAHGRFLVTMAVLTCGAAVIAAFVFRPGKYPLELGRPFDPTQAISVAAALGLESRSQGERVVIRGQVGEVCRAAGCWFVLQEVKDGRLYEILVDLKRHGDLTVQPEISGRGASVSGKLVVDDSNVTFQADAIRIE